MPSVFSSRHRVRSELYQNFTFSLPKFRFATVKESKLVAKDTFQKVWQFLGGVLGGNPSNCQRSGGVLRLKPRTVPGAQFNPILIDSGQICQRSSDGVRTNCEGVNPSAENNFKNGRARLGDGNLGHPSLDSDQRPTT